MDGNHSYEMVRWSKVELCRQEPLCDNSWIAHLTLAAMAPCARTISPDAWAALIVKISSKFDDDLWPVSQHNGVEDV